MEQGFLLRRGLGGLSVLFCAHFGWGRGVFVGVERGAVGGCWFMFGSLVAGKIIEDDVRIYYAKRISSSLLNKKK